MPRIHPRGVLNEERTRRREDRRFHPWIGPFVSSRPLNVFWRYLKSKVHKEYVKSSSNEKCSRLLLLTVNDSADTASKDRYRRRDIDSIGLLCGVSDLAEWRQASSADTSLLLCFTTQRPY